MSNITKLFNIDTKKLSEYKITFDERTGEFTTVITLGFGLAFEQTVQIAKFDFLNLYLPDCWFFNKHNIAYQGYKPSPEYRIIQPYYSKNKGCAIIPNGKIVNDHIDTTQLILNNFSVFELYYQKIQSKWKYHISTDSRTSYEQRIEYDIRNRESFTLGTTEVLGKKYYSFPIKVEDREYCILIPHNALSKDEWFFAKKIDNGYIDAFTYQYREQSFNDIANHKVLNSIRCIRTAEGYKNGPRLHKFLMQCALMNILVDKDGDSFVLVSPKVGLFAIISKLNKGEDKYGWQIKFPNDYPDIQTELILRGTNSNATSMLTKIEYEARYDNINPSR